MVKVATFLMVAIALLPSPFQAFPRRGRREASVHICGIPAVCNCINDLRWVDCSNRYLNEVPTFPRFVYLSTVRLIMAGNNVSSIPGEDYWKRWKSLEGVDFSDNPVCQPEEMTVMGDRQVEIVSEVCPTVQTVQTTTEQPPVPSRRRRLPLAPMGNTTTTTTSTTTTTTTTTVRSISTEVDDEDRGTGATETTTRGTEGPTVTEDQGPKPKDEDHGSFTTSRERLIMIGSLSVSLPLGVTALTCCIRGLFKRVTKSVKRGKSEKELAKEARDKIRKARKQRGSLSAIFDCACNVGVPEACETSFSNPRFFIEEEEEEVDEDEIVFNQPTIHDGVRQRTPSLSKEE